MSKLSTATGAAAGLVLLYSVVPTEGTTAWKSIAGLNCFTSDAQGFMGGEVITSTTNPIVSPVRYMSVEQCLEACEGESECTAVVMQNTVPDNPTCWLRKGIVLSSCTKNFPDFDLWLRPGQEPAGMDSAQTAFSYPATYCKNKVIKTAAATTAERCEIMCRGDPDCEAINYERSSNAKKHTADSLRCQLVKEVSFDDCEALPNIELRLIRLPTGGTGGGTGGGSSGTGSGSTGTGGDSTGGDSTDKTDTRGGWPTVAATNCYTGVGADRVAEDGLDPATGHLVLADCQQLCMSKSDCQGVIMADQGGHHNNCWLRRDFDLSKCEANERATVWFKPGQKHAGADEWVSFAGKNCYPGRGALYAKDDEDVLTGHKMLTDCEKACKQTVGCEAIVWHDTKDAVTDNCYLRKHVKVADCKDNPEYNLRLHMNALHSATDGLHGDSNGGGGSGGTGGTGGGDPDAPRLPWPTVANHNCVAGKGAESVSAAGHDPVSGHLHLGDCQAQCMLHADCQAVVMHDNGNANNCWLRKTIDLSQCEELTSSTVWFKPGEKHTGADEWVSYSGVNCYPGMGGDYAVADQDVLPGHKNLVECEKACKTTTGCEAIVWHDTHDNTRPNCYLRKNVKVDKCHQNNEFNLRLDIQALSSATDGKVTGTGTGSGTGGGTGTGSGGTGSGGTGSGGTGSGGTGSGSGGSSGPSTEPLQPWPTLASHDCSTKGGESISTAGFDPLAGHHLTLDDCQKKCREHSDCEAIAMKDNGLDDNCWLRKKIDISTCESDASSTLWFLPGKTHTGADEWVSYAGVNCYPGRGADYAVHSEDVLPGHKALADCEKACKDQDGCEGIVWHDTKDNSRSNCYLRKNIKVEDCHRNSEFNLRLIHRGSTGGGSGGGDSGGGTGSGSGGSGGGDSGGGSGDSQEKPDPNGWPTQSNRNCHAGNGGEKLSVSGFDPYPQHLFLDRCQNECNKIQECEAVVMHDTKSANDPNCWLRKNVKLDDCEEISHSSVWFKPSVSNPKADDWLSYSGINCYPGKGAEYAIDGKNSLDTHMDLVKCEEECEKVQCEGFIWHDTMDDSRPNCYLRKNIKIKECEFNDAFNLRLRVVKLFRLYDSDKETSVISDADDDAAASSPAAARVFGSSVLMGLAAASVAIGAALFGFAAKRGAADAHIYQSRSMVRCEDDLDGLGEE